MGKLIIDGIHVNGGGGGGGSAEDLIYDNSTSGLDATNVQDAIDELSENGGGSNVNEWKGTLEEYEALPEDKYTNGVNHYIEDAISANAGITLGVFPDYSKVIREFTTAGDSWVATEDCVIAGVISSSGDGNACAFINNVRVAGAYYVNSVAAMASISSLVKKGQTVSTDTTGGYDFKAYALQHGSVNIVGGGGSNNPEGSLGNMRYDEETDMIQIYFGGQWVDWKIGNLQHYYLVRDGEFLNDLSLRAVAYGNASAAGGKVAPVVSNNVITLSTNYSEGSFYTTAISTVGKKKLVVDYTITALDESAQCHWYLMNQTIGKNNYGSDTTVVTKKFGEVLKGRNQERITHEVDLTNYQGTYYIGIWMYYAPMTIVLNNLYLE